MNFDEIKKLLQQFAEERDWNQFHTPKNLAMALSAEAGELVEIFQWLNEAQSQDLSTHDLEKTKHEIADIQIYLIRLADKLGINIEEAVKEKMRQNSEKYPAHLVRGSAKKYTEYK